MTEQQKISIVFPVYNEASNLKALYQQVKQVCAELTVDYEIIFVDDGSTDNSLEVIKGIRNNDYRVKYISLSRNFGHQNAIFAGMSYCTGDAVITMDADLQHPPALIPKMVDLWRRGAEVVYTTKKSANLSFLEHIIFSLFYWTISKISGLHLDFGQSDFRLLDRKVIKVILQIPEYHKFLRGQVQWIGFRQEALPYDVDKRYIGKSKFSYRSRFSFALDGIVAFSRYPLHLITLVGIFILGVSLVYILFILLIWVLDKFNLPHNFPLVPGWVTLAVAILFLGSTQLIAIGILGEYIGRIFDQVKGRPLFIVKEKSE